MTRDQISKILLGHQWFRGLPNELATQIIERSTQRDVAPNAVIYATGDQSTGQFAVLSGEVRLVANTADGKNILYRVLKPGGWFGHLSVLDLQPRFQDAVAVGVTRLLHLPTTAFNAIIAQEPRFILDFSQLICRDIREAMGMLAEMKATPLPRRLAQALLQSSGQASEPDSGESRMTQEALAAMMGTSRQTINRVLRRWEQERLIQIEYGRVSVRDPVTLAAVGQTEPIEAMQRPVFDESPR